MRKKGLIILVVVAAVVCIWMFVLSDKWLERRLESLMSNVVGAMVELDSFDFSLFSMSIQWARIQVADPEDTWRNIIETGYCSLNIASGPLFQKKFIVEDLKLLDLRFNTQRETDGKLEEKKKSRARKPSKIGVKIRSKLEGELSKLPVFNLDTLLQNLDVDALWKSAIPQTPEKIDNLIKEYESFSSKWNEQIKNLDMETELTGLQQELAGVDIEGLETVNDLQEALISINMISEGINNNINNLDSVGKEFKNDIDTLDKKQAGLEGWIEEDIRRVENAIQLPDITIENVAKFIFGHRLVERIQKVLRVIDKIRSINEKIRRFIPLKEIPPRLKGQDIRFVKHKRLPDLWIKMLDFSGHTSENLQITGSLTDLASEQNLTGRPAVLEVTGQKGDGSKLAIEGLFDYRSDPAREILELTMTDIVIQNMWLTDFPLLPNAIESGKADLSARLEFAGPDLLSSVSLVIEDISLDIPEKQEGASEIEIRIYELSRSVAEEISSIRIDAGLEIISDETKFAVQSNLDSLVTSKIDEIIMRDVEKVKDELEKRVQQMADESRKQLETATREVESTIKGRLDELEGTADLLLKEAEKKKLEIEIRIEDETIGRDKRKLEEERKKAEQELEDEKRKAEEEKRKAEEELLKEKERKEEELQQELQQKIESLF